MVRLVNRAKMTTATTGTGTITLGAASDGFQTFAGAGVVDGDLVRYVIEEGDNFEIGTGVFDATGGTLTRNPSESSNGGSAINLSGDAVVYVTAAAEDLQSGVNITGGTIDATVQYDNTQSGLVATNVQDAIDEVTDFFTVTVEGSSGSSDWVQASAADPFIATLTVAGIKATDRPIVSLDVSNETFEDGLMLQREFNLLYRVEASDDDEIKVYATDEPAKDLDLMIKVVR